MWQKLAKHLWIAIAAPLIVGIGVGLGVAILTGAWTPGRSGSSTSSLTTRTDVRFFDPSSGFTAKAVRIVGHAAGSCLAYSLTDPAPFVFRCFADSPHRAIYPTCFGGDDYGTRVLCVEQPWTPTAIALQVKEYDYDNYTVAHPRRPFRTGRWLPGTQEPPPRELQLVRKPNLEFTNTEAPWALELSNGEQCVAIAGATDVILGFRVNYACAPPNADTTTEGSGGWVIGGPDRRHDLWIVEYLAVNSAATTQVAVNAAWY